MNEDYKNWLRKQAGLEPLSDNALNEAIAQMYVPEEKDFDRAENSFKDGNDLTSAYKMTKLIQDRNKLGRRAAAVAAAWDDDSGVFKVFKEALKARGFSGGEIRGIESYSGSSKVTVTKAVAQKRESFSLL